MEPDRSDVVAHDAWCKKVQNAESLAADPPVPLMVRSTQALASVARIIYLTARSEEFEAVTLKWLKSRGFPAGALICRSLEDKRAGWDYKGSVIQMIQSQYPKDKIVSIDDDPTGECSPIYRQLGVLHLKVMWCAFDEEGQKQAAYK